MEYQTNVNRSFATAGSVGARVQNSSYGVKKGQPQNADAFLINMSRLVFAVADGSDANPAYSREFLEQFNGSLEKLITSHPDVWNGSCSVEEIRKRTVDMVHTLMRAADPRSFTTFTALMVVPLQHPRTGIVIHAGDSCMFLVDVLEKYAKQLTWSSINFVGKTRAAPQSDLVELHEAARILICSDGLQALARNTKRRTLVDILAEAFSAAEVDQIPSLLLDHYGKDIEFPDDVTVIALDPNRLNGTGPTVLGGGQWSCDRISHPRPQDSMSG